MDASPDSSGAATETWLGVFTRLLHLPEAQRQAIRAELQAHIHERTRDLMLDGCDERSAARQAIDELGEIAQLARRFDAADRPRTRRTFMHLAILTVVATATVTGAVMLKPSTHPVAMRVFEQRAEQLEPPAEVGEVPITLQPDMTMESLVDLVVNNAKLGVSVDWEKMEEIGLSRETPLGIGGQDMPLVSALTLLSRRSTAPQEQFAWRFRDRMLLLASADQFDREESILTSYSVADVLDVIMNHGDATRDEAAGQLANLITHFVEPESWVDNGGQLAKLSIVGGKMFVQAPPRTQERVAWIVGELGAGEGEQARSRSDRAQVLFPAIPVLDHFGQPVELGTLDNSTR